MRIEQTITEIDCEDFKYYDEQKTIKEQCLHFKNKRYSRTVMGNYKQ